MSGQRIDRLYAWIAAEPDGGEGLCAASIGGDGMFMRLVGADRARIESYREIALTIGQMSNRPVRLVEFSVRTDLDALVPGAPN